MPDPPKVDLSYAMQFLGQLYGSVAAIDKARLLVPEQERIAEKIKADNERAVQEGSTIQSDNAKLRGENAKLREEQTRLQKEHETLRSEVGNQQAQLTAIKQQFADIEAALPRRK